MGGHFSYGGIAYHHIADSYVALFSHFIPCGTWEAVYIIDGLLQNKSDIQPDTIHGDTQAQSTPVFALSYLLGIKLMPRIRNWQDLTFYRPAKETVYQHIDSLFKDSIDWDLIVFIGKIYFKLFFLSTLVKFLLLLCSENWVIIAVKIDFIRLFRN